MLVQLTPGQICLLELMQRKLLGTLQLYDKLRMDEKEAGPGSLQQRAIVEELDRLKEKIKRISARQKRFTSEIINGNGINTIPKESYFKALGLVTKETLNQLNSKSNERRRRTTANPRFSHEAIQARKALQKPRIEPKVTRDKRAEATRNTASNKSSLSSSNNNNNDNTIRNNNNNRNAQQKPTNLNSDDLSAKTNQKNSGSSRVGVSTKQTSNHDEALSPLERQILFEKFKLLQQQLDAKSGLIKMKMHTIKAYEADNIRILGAIDKVQMDIGEEDNDLDYRGIKEALERAAKNFSTSRLSQDNSPPQTSDISKPGLEGLKLKLDEDPSHQGEAIMRTIEACLKCDESLDGID